MSSSKSRHEKRKRETKSSESYKDAKHAKTECKNFSKYKYELRNFLPEYVKVKSVDEFWTFHDKLTRLKKPSDINKKNFLNITFDLSDRDLFDKLPTLDRHGDKIDLTYENFEDFLNIVRIYHDFQEKSEQQRIKKIKEAQDNLPIAEYKSQIIETLKTHRVLLIAGDTGCGKSTQVPRYIYEAGYQKTVCTQPRRIACISLSKRVAYEMLVEDKSVVGYQIRFEKTKKADTNVIFMTEGLLLRQINEDDLINSYDVIILDEVHERHLHCDFLVGLMKCLLHKNDQFKLILMSATINLKLFQEYFVHEELATIQVPGRLYPIEIHYVPTIKDPYENQKTARFNSSPYLKILQMIDDKYASKGDDKGDVLIFLNGFYEISALMDVLKDYASIKRNWIILPLHSSLPLDEQDKVFDYPPDGVRKCIISTNIAETSITIDGIRFVVDSGKVNRMSFINVGGINKLCEVNISQDSAKQRAGRAGRTGPGICYRLYSEEDFNDFEPFTPAEIHLVPLESILLNMISLGLSDISNFPFLERPSNRSIEESIEKLKFCGALELNDTNTLMLTSLGETLNQLPVDLSIGKMLIMSTIFGNTISVLTLASLLSVQNPINQFSNSSQSSRDSFESNHGDPIILLNIYKEWLMIKQKGSVSSKNKESSRYWARKRGIEEQRLYEATKLIQQFKDILRDANLIDKAQDEELSSSERRIRYGELKQLKTLKNDLKNESKFTRKKQLKLEEYSEEDKYENVDLRDVEFRITNDFKKLQKLLNETSTTSYKDLALLKLIISCGFYPQIACQDEFNSLKTVNEHLYHTKDKSYVFLRPNSFFATKPDVLELHDDDIEVPPAGYFSKRPISKKHQVLIYQSILETKKIYLVNTMRMNAIQTLLLFSKFIGTNSTLTRFVFDDFLATDLPYIGQGKTLLRRAIDLRKTWKVKLESKLNRTSNNNKESEAEQILDFVDDLVHFLRTEVSYNLKRLLPADLKVIYNNNSDNDENVYENLDVNPFDDDYKPNINKKFGGINVTENVVYNCVIHDDWDANLEIEFMNTTYHCQYCNESLAGVTFFKVLQHEGLCKKTKKQIGKDDEASTSKTESSEKKTKDSSSNVNKANCKMFVCDKCNSELYLTPIEMLKHKKSCA